MNIITYVTVLETAGRLPVSSIHIFIKWEGGRQAAAYLDSFRFLPFLLSFITKQAEPSITQITMIPLLRCLPDLPCLRGLQL